MLFGFRTTTRFQLQFTRSLDEQQRHKVEQAMVNGQLRAVVCTGILILA